MKETKSQPITKRMVWEAYKRVKSNGGSAGIDNVSLDKYEENLSKNLYKLWNRLSSGSYFPPPVKEVAIPKGDGKVRKLGIPTVADRVAQMVVKQYLEPSLEPIFHNSSYGYRPNRSAHDAIGEARKNCWKISWVIDMDIKGFFDEINHDLMLKALSKHTDEKWVKMYVTRWLTAPVVTQEGEQLERTKGTPQGGVISPLLANLYLHYAYDKWMEINFPLIKFERYADDIILHCSTEKQAEYILTKVRTRLQECHLELHPTKTKIVYCRDDRRKLSTEKEDRFTFLGYEFKSRACKDKRGRIFYSFNPAISSKAVKKIIKEFRELKIQKWVVATIEEVAVQLNAKIRGWINYYGKFHKSELHKVFRRLNFRLASWRRRKYKKLKRSWYQSRAGLKQLIEKQPNLFVHWKHGFKS